MLSETSRRLAAKLAGYLEEGRVSPDSKVLFVDDGSRDATWPEIEKLHMHGDADGKLGPGMFRGLRLSHNAGHQNALYAGLMQALNEGCDCAISLDADLQDDVNAMDEMLAAHEAGAEVVYGVRNNRDSDTRFKRETAGMFYSLMHLLGVEMVPNSADYRLMGQKSLAALSEYGEANLFLRGIVPSLGFSTANVYYRRAERFAGESKYPLRKMVSFAVEGITSFSIVPIRLVTLLGLISIGVSICMVVYALASWLSGSTVAGWSSLMISIWLIGGLIMVSLGMVGEYVGRTYLESKRRPRYIVAEVLR